MHKTLIAVALLAACATTDTKTPPASNGSTPAATKDPAAAPPAEKLALGAKIEVFGAT